MTAVTDAWIGQAPAPPAGREVDAEPRPGGAPARILALSLTVTGSPKPKGSLKHVGNGRLVDQVKGTMKWGNKVAADAKETWGRAAPLDEPVIVELVVTVAALKTPSRWPSTRSSSDLDKHQRNVGDALTSAGVLKDDSRIIRWEAEKTYPGHHPDALDRPGAVIRIWTIGHSL